MESTLRSQRKSHETSHRVSTSTCKHSFEPESLSRLVHSTTAASAYDKVRDFIEAVGPFHRAVYLIALAYENDAAGAELIAVQAMATAFRTWQGQQMGNELKMFLIGITIAEAQSYLHRNRVAVIRDCREDIGDVFVCQSAREWRPIPLHARHDRAEYDALIGAMQEFSTNTRLALLMRDALHLRSVQIAGLLGELRQRVQIRLGYGRITLCMKLSMRGSDLDLSGQARVSTVC